MAEDHFQPLEDLGEDTALGAAEQDLEFANNMQGAGMIPQLIPGQNQAAQQGQQPGVPRQNRAAEPGPPPDARQRQQDEIVPLQAVYARPAEQPRTFTALYANPQKDPLINSYPLVLARFDAMIEEPEAPEDLLNSVLSNSTLPNTFLCCAVLNNARPRIYVLHKISRFPRAFDGRETPWDDALFGFLGDVTGTAVQTVRLPANPFAITQQITLYDDAALAEELPRLRNDALFPRLPLAHQQAVVVRTRTLMYLPTKYAPLLLNS
jgi:hypothetical protein